MLSNATQPDLDDSVAADSQQAAVIVASVVSWAIAALFVGLRSYTRGSMLRMFGPEDWCLVVSVLFSMANSICMIIQAVNGLGLHMITLPVESIMNFGRAGWLAILWYILSLGFTKCGILLLYIRILTYDSAKLISKIMLAAVIITHLYMMCVVLTACIPIQKFWNPSLEGYCHPQPFWWSVTGINIASDFLVFLIPLPVIFTMAVPLKQKLGLYFVFAVGFFVCVISFVRLKYLLSLYDSIDTTWDNAPIGIWTCIEVNTAIVCACLVTIKPLIIRLLPRLLLDRNARTYRPQASSDDTPPHPPTIGSKPVRLILAEDPHAIDDEEKQEHEVVSYGSVTTTLHDTEACRDRDTDAIMPPAKALVK